MRWKPVLESAVSYQYRGNMLQRCRSLCSNLQYLYRYQGSTVVYKVLDLYGTAEIDCTQESSITNRTLPATINSIKSPS